MVLLFILIMVDFLVTYYGISLGVIRELNPLHAWSFNLPFWSGLCVRLAVALLVITPFYILFRREKQAYRKAIKIAYAINIIIMGMHLHWILFCL